MHLKWYVKNKGKLKVLSQLSYRNIKVVLIFICHVLNPYIVPLSLSFAVMKVLSSGALIYHEANKIMLLYLTATLNKLLLNLPHLGVLNLS